MDPGGDRRHRVGGRYCRPRCRPFRPCRSRLDAFDGARVAGLAFQIVRDFLAGRFGVDAIALVSMSAALALGQPLAGAVVALMYSGGNVLEDIAVARAEHDLRSLVDRAPREAHRRTGDRIEEVRYPRSRSATGFWCGRRDHSGRRHRRLDPATIDESALTGEPIRWSRRAARHPVRLAECRRDLRADGVGGGGESTYAASFAW